MSGIDWGRDRRRTARVDLLADLQGHVVTLDERIRVRQVSQGGLTIETSAPLSARLVHEFRVSVGERSALVRARVAHSRIQMQGDSVAYLSGLEFVEPAPQAVAILEEIVALAQETQRGPHDAGPAR